jgi:hypothetical protein
MNNPYVIYKYPLKLVDEQLVEMPFDAQMLSAQMQGPTLCLWALVNQNNSTDDYRVFVVGTGNPFPENCSKDNYVGTTQHGPLVWHVFVKKP